MIVSLDVRTVNVFVFLAIWVHFHLDFNTRAFGHFVFLLRKKVTTPLSLKVPIHLWDHRNFCFLNYFSFTSTLASGRSINSFWQTPQLTFHFHINDFFFTVTTTASLSIRVLLPRAFSFKEKRYNKCTCIHASVLMWIVFINIWRILYYYLRCGWDNKQLV